MDINQDWTPGKMLQVSAMTTHTHRPTRWNWRWQDSGSDRQCQGLCCVWRRFAAKLCEKSRKYTCTPTAPSLRHKLIMWKNTTFSAQAQLGKPWGARWRLFFSGDQFFEVWSKLFCLLCFMTLDGGKTIARTVFSFIWACACQKSV